MRLLFLFLLFLASCSESRESSDYKIGRDRSFYPLNLMGKERYLLGYTDDLLHTVAEMGKVDFSIFTDSQNRLLANLRAGDYDGIVTFVRLSPRERGSFIASNPFFLLGPVIVVSSDSPIQTYSDLKNKSVGILQSSDRIFDIDSDPTIVYTTYENMLIALRDLAKGELDAVIMNAPQAYEYTNSFYAGSLRLLWPPLTQDGLRLVAKKNKEGEKLISLFNEGLKELEESGQLKTLQESWNLYRF